MSNYGSVCSQSLTLCGTYWSDTYTPTIQYMTELWTMSTPNTPISTLNTLSMTELWVQSAKWASVVATVIHCVNEMVVVSVLKWFVVRQGRCKLEEIRGTGGTGTGTETGGTGTGGTGTGTGDVELELEVGVVASES